VNEHRPAPSREPDLGSKLNGYRACLFFYHGTLCPDTNVTFSRLKMFGSGSIKD
jgi:hypothetical protein